MPRLTPLSVKKIIQKLKKLGFTGPIHGGRHSHMTKGTTVIPLPIHGGKDIGIGLQSTIIKQIGTTREKRINL